MRRPERVVTRIGIVAEVSAGAGQGEVVTLLVMPHHTDLQVERAKAELRRQRDVVMMCVKRLEAERG
jgi:hypothetical protein